MASSKFLVFFALFFTCLSLANSENFKSKGWEQTEIVNLNDETDVKEPEQSGGGYNTGRCRYGCCYRGSYGCIRCCRYPNEVTNSVGMQKRGRNQVAEKTNEETSPVWAQGQP